LQPTPETSINCYADFAGLWNQEDHNDENCVKGRTGYVICMSDCPVLWITHLQEGTALSTMEAEYGALSMAMHDLLPFKRLIQSIFMGVRIVKDQQFNICCNVFKEHLP